jgi:hypothetical protein
MAESLTIFQTENNIVFVIGTAYVLPIEEEPSKGRILMFEVLNNKRLNLLNQKEVRGCVYSLSSYEKDMIVAGVNAHVFFIKI